MDPVLAGHVIAVDLPAKREDVASHGAESDVVTVDLALNRARLIGAFEIAGDSVAVLRDLNVLDDRLAVVDIAGINRPVALDIVRGLLCEYGRGTEERQQSEDYEAQRRTNFFHDFLPNLLVNHLTYDWLVLRRLIWKIAMRTPKIRSFLCIDLRESTVHERSGIHENS
jgi:hypothetical protein